ncbi:peptidyl-prolyl cis-trans isomerase B (cyclophilin B) [Elusimicrobium simillimum]|uniref:peptidylprolyl isomerase n=1 Tax=Elusimicrobium simillimum TaxID=3143438 RepID=UPI003C6F2627
MLKIFKLIVAALLIVGAIACARKEMPAKEKETPAKQQIANTQENKMYVNLKTSKGDIVIELDAKNAPKTVENFVKYVKDGHYDGTIFHRVIKDFMVQGGGMDAGMRERKTRAPIMNEANNGLDNNKYTIAMARTSDPDSASAQFFINTNNNDFLNFKAPTTQGWGYAVFGKVVSGQKVVDAMQAVLTGRKGYHDDVPVEAIVIEKAEVLENYKPAAK